MVRIVTTLQGLETCGVLEIKNTTMCYEFVHSCKPTITNELELIIAPDDYFLICIGDINYLYVHRPAITEIAKRFFLQKKIKLHRLTEDEMISVIDFPGMNHYQSFHGNIRLLETLRNKIRVPELFSTQ